MWVVSIALVLSAGAGATVDVSALVVEVVVSDVLVLDVPPPHAAAKAPSANTNKSFFIVFDLFL